MLTESMRKCKLIDVTENQTEANWVPVITEAWRYTILEE